MRVNHAIPPLPPPPARPLVSLPASTASGAVLAQPERNRQGATKRLAKVVNLLIQNLLTRDYSRRKAGHGSGSAGGHTDRRACGCPAPQAAEESRPRPGTLRDVGIPGLCEHDGMGTEKDPAMRRIGAPVEEFLAGLPDERRREDARRLCVMMEEVTGEQPAMWGTSIIGFGSYHYRYDNRRCGPPAPAGNRGRSVATTRRSGTDSSTMAHADAATLTAPRSPPPVRSPSAAGLPGSMNVGRGPGSAGGRRRGRLLRCLLRRLTSVFGRRWRSQAAGSPGLLPAGLTPFAGARCRAWTTAEDK